MPGQKITMAEARAGGASSLRVYCDSAAEGGDCHHNREIALAPLIDRVGGGVRLDDLPFRCGACGCRRIDVRPVYDARAGATTFATWGNVAD